MKLKKRKTKRLMGLDSLSHLLLCLHCLVTRNSCFFFLSFVKTDKSGQSFHLFLIYFFSSFFLDDIFLVPHGNAIVMLMLG